MKIMELTLSMRLKLAKRIMNFFWSKIFFSQQPFDLKFTTDTTATMKKNA